MDCLKRNFDAYKVLNKNHLSPNATPSIYSDITFYVSKPLCQFLKISRVQGRITFSDVFFPYWDHRMVTRERGHSSLNQKIPKSSQGQYQALWTCCLSVALVTRKHKYFPGICNATGGQRYQPSHIRPLFP